ncbi:hypothetical protein [Candidatus Igneacidithiobacillus taiwanensis]|uniref:hypothetical protein n=1 Tax=Candidatus Igneacidithiobacillus taiwanensis TaxID=1945924 RepID=UPI0028988355|nr:hypothetical protein [Candidatus Igneacidithiobacillus taiwanensis]
MKRLLLVGMVGAALVATFFVGGREGYGYCYQSGYKAALAAIRHAVAIADYPTVKIVYPSKEAIAVIKGGVCTPILPGTKLPTYYHIEYVSPYDRPCGPGKPGQPYQDSSALAAITHEVQAGD